MLENQIQWEVSEAYLDFVGKIAGYSFVSSKGIQSVSMFILPIFCYSQLPNKRVLVCQIEYVLIQNISRSL